MVVNILDEEISNSPHMCASQELKVGVNSLAGFSKNNIHEWGLHYKSNTVLAYQVFGASIDWSTHFWSTAKTSDQGSTFVHEPYIHTYIHMVEMKSNSLNKSPNGWMGCFFMNDLSSSLGTFWPQSLEFSTLFRTQ